ncbi:MAG: cobalamin-binding protein [Syntrophobacterales bacterium]|jgi:iron complex transport system substrate-binding protein|nr:cobalamin-binding protein [Syntrophobacterales bacterium]
MIIFFINRGKKWPPAKKIFGISGIFFSLVFLVFPLDRTLAETPQRIISLAPNITEILYDLGLGKQVIGVTTYCNYPPDAAGKRKVGSMSNPSLETIVNLRPDMVVLTTDGNTRAIANRLVKLNIPIYVFRAKRLGELPAEIRKMGAALGVKDKAEQAAQAMETSLQGYLRQTANFPPVKALFVVQTEPLLVAGPDTAIDDALNIFRLQNIAADASLPYPQFSLEEVIRRDPDIIFVICSHRGAYTQYDTFLRKIRQLKAVRQNNIFCVGDPLLRMGPRIKEGLAEMSQHLATKHKRGTD